ncbi:PPOX class probable F420-dependent enzyme [Nocardiopsis mwathae]|uniref:PPOX class probable F420-dependent enzyme n=1 Tax=Nocardiopsis mwathae TaxID=1472723 RepID=A0A7W9YKH9_9ACTN|nr:PPOX class probable F420-dependent enzyme [Nocardiopsis mwathae]
MTRWTSEYARERFASGRVARLATVDAHGQPHLVPVTFAVFADAVVIAIDHKPKSTRDVKRLANIEANPLVSLLVDEYSDYWERLWWARADGSARIEYSGETWETARDHLARRYPQYREQPPDGPIILVTVQRWSGWSFR